MSPVNGIYDSGIRPKISAVISALNEKGTIGEVVARSLLHVDEVIVIDDGSTDGTPTIAETHGAKVLINEMNLGVLPSLKRGFQAATGDIWVTLDADGQHDPDDIPALVAPILTDEADLVLGKRPEIPYFSEKVIALLTSLKVKVGDASTGFRAIRRNFGEKMGVHGSCPCGTFILEAHSLGARVAEVSINVRERSESERRIKTRHLTQVLHVIHDLLRY
ncbi:MAG: glycosyltransferase family 2 protein [Candidatus Bathyarchaeota archaeon]|jgi:glycosyltransferase involved in cell wall biosynthesis